MTDQAASESFFHPSEFLAILFRRRYWLIPCVVLGLLAATAAILLQKPMYRSSASLLIDSQLVPTSLVASPLTTISNERIAKIRQQIVSNRSLTTLIRETGLYPAERARMPISDVLGVMRSAIAVDLVGANQGDSGGSTIAFTLSFTYQDPVKAQEVTQHLTRMFLVEDKRFRTEQASGTAAFLERRAEEFRRQLARLEDKRRAVEAHYAGALPEHVALSVQSGSALRAEVSRTDAETQGLVQQNNLLAVRMRDETHAVPPGQEALRRAEERLNQLSSVYADTYPDVKAARAAVELQRDLAGRSPPGSDVLETELAANHSRIEVLAQRRSQLVREMGDIERRAAQAPQAAYELNMIEREYDNIKRQYESLREKQLDAQVTANLQAEDKGERFSVVDEPSLPHETLGKKPRTLLLAGLFAGAGAGIVLVLAFELLSGTIHGEATLTRLLKSPPLGVIPLTSDPAHPPRFNLGRWLSRARTAVTAHGGMRLVR